MHSLLTLLLFSEVGQAQTSSYGPGKGAPQPGMKSIYTYPQPRKPTPVGPEKMLPAFEVPDQPEKYIWKLSTKVLGPNARDTKIQIWTFDANNGRRISVGSIDAGSEVLLEEFRVSGNRNFYKVKWSGTVPEGIAAGKDPDFFVDGAFIEFAGKK